MHEKQYNGGSTRDPAAKCRETQSRTAGVLANFFACFCSASTAWLAKCRKHGMEKIMFTCKIFEAIFGTQDLVKNGGPPQYVDM